MKHLGRLALLVFGLVSVLSVLGWKIKGRFLMDGPGMVNPASWDSFTVSRSDSYAQYNFWIKVEQRNEGFFATGEVRGDDGTIYHDEEGIQLSSEEAKRVYDLEPALLPDVVKKEETDLIADGIEVLDQANVNIEVICTDGRKLEKIDEDDFSIKVYQIVMPCFEKTYK